MSRYKENLNQLSWPEDEMDCDEIYKILMKNMEIPLCKTFEIKENKKKGNKIPLKDRKFMKKR